MQASNYTKKLIARLWAKPDLRDWVNCKMGVIKPEREEAFKAKPDLRDWVNCKLLLANCCKFMFSGETGLEGLG